MWESVLGCRGSSLKRGVGKVRRDGGCEKMWGRYEKVWKSVLSVRESEKRCGKVCWGVGK